MNSKKLKNATLSRKKTQVIEAPAQRVGQSAKGKYKFEVRDADGVVYDSGDWKPNLILDCGLDKLADMAWAQTFQWCVAGTDPTPTVEKFENTRLKVSMDLWNSCDNPEAGRVFPDGKALECWEDDMPAIRVRATNGCREAPELPIAFDPKTKRYIKNVPPNATGFTRSFGKLTEIGTTLYLRDQDLQFKVIGSCPQYLVEPLQAKCDVVAAQGYCSTLSALSFGVSGSTMVEGVLSGELYDVDFDGAGTLVDRGIVATHKHRLGQGYVGLPAWSGNTTWGSVGTPAAQGNPGYIPPGDPNVPLLDPVTGAVNPSSGIRVGYPQGRAGKLRAEISVKNTSTGISDSDVQILDRGDGYGYFEDCPDGRPEITFEAPPTNAHWAVWNNDDDNNWNKKMYSGQYNQRYSGLLRNCGRAGPINTGHQYEVQHAYTSWTGDMWSTHGTLSNLTKETYEYIWGDGTETVTNSRFPMGYGVNQNPPVEGSGTSFDLPLGYNPSASKYEVMISQLLLMHFLPFSGPTGHHWYNSPTKVKWKSPLDPDYDAADPTKRDATAYFMGPEYTSVNQGDWINGYPNYYANQENLEVTGVLDVIRACDQSNGLPVGGGAKFSDGNDNVMNAIRQQWSSDSNLETAIKNSELSLVDLLQVNNVLSPGDVFIPINAIKYLGHRHDAYHVNPAGPVNTPAGPGGELQRIIQAWVPINGAFTSGHFEPETKYDFYATRVGFDSYFVYAGNTCTYDGFGTEPNLFHRMGGAAEPNAEIAFSLLTDENGVVKFIVVNPKRWISQLITDQTNGQANQRHRELCEHLAANMSEGALYVGNFYQGQDPRTIDPPLPQRRPATGTCTIKNCKIDTVTVTDVGRGYGIKANPKVVLTGPIVERAEIGALVDTRTGWITGFDVINPGLGYSCTEPIPIEFPPPPVQDIMAWDLLVKPIQTYETVNNNYLYQSLDNGIADDIFQDENCDIYHTEQTYLGSGKSHFAPGTVTNGPRDGGYVSQPNVRTGPCHFVEFGYPRATNGVLFEQTTAGVDYTQPGTYTMSRQELDANPDWASPPPVERVEHVTHNQYKTHGWYLTGTDAETNSLYCGTDFLTSGNQVVMTRTFDFYMELQPVTYTEIGFKESPAARELFSRIVFDDPIRLRAGQYLRVSYQLLLTMEPGPYARYREVPSEGTWTNGQREWVDENTGTRTVTPVLTGYECIQGNGIAVVGSDGVAIPYDVTGVANEPFAPGSYYFGPQYGYVNRWKNGDPRLSYPTKEYKSDVWNPWIHGGDQHNPPDWAIRHFRSPTQNYMPRSFTSFLEWPVTLRPAAMIQVERASTQTDHIGAYWSKSDKKSIVTIPIPPGPEYTLERDAFAHWYVPFSPVQSKHSGHLMWTNYVANGTNNGNLCGTPNTGRWDVHITKPYLKDIYPHMMPRDTNDASVNNSETGTAIYESVADWPTTEKPTPAWIDKYKDGKYLGTDTVNKWYSGRGVFMSPVVEYDGPAGGLFDPTTISTGRAGTHVKNPLSFTGGMGLITRQSFLSKNPYTGALFQQLYPHNNGFSGIGVHGYESGSSGWASKWSNTFGNSCAGYLDIILNNSSQKFDTRGCNMPYRASGSAYAYGKRMISTNPKTGAYWASGSSTKYARGHYCWSQVPVIKDGYTMGPFDLIRRQRVWEWMSNLAQDGELESKYPTWPGRGTAGPQAGKPTELTTNNYGNASGFTISPAYGGGFSSLEGWKTWTHTPNLRVVSNWRGGTKVSVPGAFTGNIAPDTAGNWAGSEVIPVAGSSAFITTANREFAIVGQWQNLSHTVFGAVSGVNKEPTHDFDAGAPISEEAASADGWTGPDGITRRITNAERVASTGNPYVRSYETPTFLNDYTRGDHRREKYAEFETSFANLTGVCAIGLGPTSTTMMPIEMTDAARFNSYVFKFGTPTFAPDRFDNLTTYKLKTTFLHAWYRDLT